MQRVFFIAAGLIGALGVGFGAAAAHGLEQRLTPEAIEWVDTASRYMLWHALALFGCALAVPLRPGVMLKVTGILFLLGTVLFSGSLLILAFFETRSVAIAAPIGGFTLILGWLSLIIVGIRKEKTGNSE